MVSYRTSEVESEPVRPTVQNTPNRSHGRFWVGLRIIGEPTPLSADLAQHIPEVAGNWLSRIRETLAFICPVRSHFLGRRMENMEKSVSVA
jgi:hypothetical protein